MKSLEELIQEMGYAFRDITYHTDGRYSCRLGYGYYKGIKGNKEFFGKTPFEAVNLAYETYSNLEPIGDY